MSVFCEKYRIFALGVLPFRLSIDDVCDKDMDF